MALKGKRARWVAGLNGRREYENIFLLWQNKEFLETEVFKEYHARIVQMGVLYMPVMAMSIFAAGSALAHLPPSSARGDPPSPHAHLGLRRGAWTAPASWRLRLSAAGLGPVVPTAPTAAAQHRLRSFPAGGCVGWGTRCPPAASSPAPQDAGQDAGR